MNEDFRDLLAVLLEARVRFLVVGAHAMAVHGVPRATGDLDVWISPETDNGDRAWSAIIGVRRAHGFHGRDAIRLRAI